MRSESNKYALRLTHFINTVLRPLDNIYLDNHYQVNDKFIEFIRCISDPTTSNLTSKNQLTDITAFEQRLQVYEDIINLKKDSKGDYDCFIEFDGIGYSVSQTYFEPTTTHIRNLRTGEKKLLENTPLPELQRMLLIKYVNESRDLGLQPTLNKFNLDGINLSGIAFGSMFVNNHNLCAMLRQGGNIQGILLETAPDLVFNEDGINKTLALQLIQLGLDTSSVINGYLERERCLGNKDIDIGGFDIPNLNWANIDLLDADLTPFSRYRYQGMLTLNGALFSVDIVRGKTQVTTALPVHKFVAKKIAMILDHAKESEITQMTHSALPPALQRLTPDHWSRIAATLLNTDMEKKVKFTSIMHKTFYKNIYRKASSEFNYSFCQPANERQRRWSDFVEQAMKDPTWRPEAVQHGQAGEVQIGKKTAERISAARVFLRYHDSPTKSRMQFVVRSDAGLKLYEDIAMAIDRYINEKCHGNPALCPVIKYKVFSEDRQVGQSDSAVLYLSESLNDSRVQELVAYLNQSIGSRIAPINIIGATPVSGTYIQGISVPDFKSQKKILGGSTSSHGSIIKRILAKAYKQAFDDQGQFDVDLLNQRAQFYAKEIWGELGL